MGDRTIHIDALMSESGVKFGTSGARGLVKDMTDEVCYACTLGFIRYLEDSGELKKGQAVAVGGDLRPSTDRIMRAVGKKTAFGVQVQVAAAQGTEAAGTATKPANEKPHTAVPDPQEPAPQPQPDLSFLF